MTTIKAKKKTENVNCNKEKQKLCNYSSHINPVTYIFSSLKTNYFFFYQIHIHDILNKRNWKKKICKPKKFYLFLWKQKIKQQKNVHNDMAAQHTIAHSCNPTLSNRKKKKNEKTHTNTNNNEIHSSSSSSPSSSSSKTSVQKQHWRYHMFQLFEIKYER